MPNTSATPGYLLPAVDPHPLQDQELDRFLQQIVAAVAGYTEPAMVRPRWQPAPPNQPDAPGTDWCAIGVRRQLADTYAAVDIVEKGPDEIDFNLQRHETVETLLSFYGANAGAFAARFRDGIQIEQNVAELSAAGMGFLEAGDIITASEKVNDIWLNRKDLSWSIRREIRRTYPVLTILSASGVILVDLPAMQIPFAVEHL